MVDALANYTPRGGKWLKINGGDSVKLRVLTLDPGVIEQSGVGKDNEPWARTQFAFIVWNWDEDSAQIWTTTQGNLNKLTKLHRDEEWDALNKIDIKVSGEGEMLEKKYEIMPLPKAGVITAKMVEQAGILKIEDEKGYKGRLSELSEDNEDDGVGNDEEESGYDKAKATANKIKGEDTVVDLDAAEEIDLSDIPF